MGKIAFNSSQQTIIDAFKKDPYLKETFYFTGGTALSVFYFGHRESEDLDFFTEEDFSHEAVAQFVATVCKKSNLSFAFRRKIPSLNILVVDIIFPDRFTLKVDFNQYPYKNIEKRPVKDGLIIDSLIDIGANKLLTINQRTEVKDFVDLYFLLKKFTLWDLMYATEAKFRMKTELSLIASDFLKVEDFDFLPKMLVPLTVKELHEFFNDQALEIGRKITE